MNNQKIPVTIMTGFLGSGKTTLLNRILSENHGKKIAVIENEFGEVGVDNELVIGADEEIFEMNNGCICCTVRGDLIRILTRLTKRTEQLDMILVETTGMANPAPVAQTFWVDDDLKEQFSLDAIITMVDAKHLELHIADSEECKEQIAFADVVILNKTDLVSEKEVANIHAVVRGMNAMCAIHPANYAGVELNKVLGVNAFDLEKRTALNPEFAKEEFPFEAVVKYELAQGKYTLALEQGPDPSIDLLIKPFSNIESQKQEATVIFSGDPVELYDGDGLELDRLLRLTAKGKSQSFEFITGGGALLFFTEHGPDEFNMQLKKEGEIVKPIALIEIEHTHTHDDEISSVGIEFDSPLDLSKFNLWIGTLLQTYGQDIFRSKGVLYFSDYEARVVFQGVHMLFEVRPDRLWKKDEKKGSQLVFIGRNLDRAMLNEGVTNCLA